MKVRLKGDFKYEVDDDCGASNSGGIERVQAGFKPMSVAQKKSATPAVQGWPR